MNISDPSGKEARAYAIKSSSEAALLLSMPRSFLQFFSFFAFRRIGTPTGRSQESGFHASPLFRLRPFFVVSVAYERWSWYAPPQFRRISRVSRKGEGMQTYAPRVHIIPQQVLRQEYFLFSSVSITICPQCGAHNFRYVPPVLDKAVAETVENLWEEGEILSVWKRKKEARGKGPVLLLMRQMERYENPSPCVAAAWGEGDVVRTIARCEASREKRERRKRATTSVLVAFAGGLYVAAVAVLSGMPTDIFFRGIVFIAGVSAIGAGANAIWQIWRVVMLRRKMRYLAA